MPPTSRPTAHDRQPHARATVVLVALTLCPAASCQKSLPDGADSLAGVTVYENANYEGRAAVLTTSIADLGHYEGPCKHRSDETTVFDWEDCISSIRVSPGWQARVFTRPDYRGQSLVVDGDVPNLQLVPGDCEHDGLNDCISSIEVTPP